MRKGVFVLFVTLAALLAVSPIARAQGGVPVVVLDGQGWGHGVGLAQWGAKYMADAGASHEDILGIFYPGTDLSNASGTVRVAVYTSDNNRATLSFPYGGEIRSSPDGDQAPGFPVQFGPGGSAVITYDGRYHVNPVVKAQAASNPVVFGGQSTNDSCIPLVNCPTTTTTQPSGGGGGGQCVVLCATTTTAPPTTAPLPTSPPPDNTAPPPSTAPSGGGGGGGDSTSPSSDAPVWAASNGTTGVNERGRHYRGLLEAIASGGPLRIVNQLDVETYVKGMGEVPSTWPVEAIAAQAVVARTYALRAMSSGGELCDYDLCQVYIGADREAQAQNDAVDMTAGQVVRYKGQLASTVYSADAGGITASTLEGFGSPDGAYPYLQVVHYDTPDPLPWHAEIALSDVASRFGYSGTVTNVTIGQAGPSGRALQVTLDGSAGPTAIDGREFAAALSLRSTLFKPTVTSADHAPPPPVGSALTQALPDDSAAIMRAARAGEASIHARATKSNVVANPVRHAKDLASQPYAWISVLLLVLGTAYVFARGDVPTPSSLQLADELHVPILRWPG